MTNQTHKVSTDALDTLGTIIDANAGRDAIHLAVEPVVAYEWLHPGQNVGFIDDKREVGIVDNPVGIVDPFLTRKVKPGERFWLVVYPRTITSLRHVWSHPAFSEELPSEVSKVNVDERVKLITSEHWLMEFTETHDCPNYDTLMRVLRSASGSLGSNRFSGFSHDDNIGFVWENDSLFFSGIDAHSDIPPEFWDHVSVVLGKPVPREKRAAHFSCSC